MSPEVQAAVERVTERLTESERFAKSVGATSVSTTFKDRDIRALSSALAEANERASLLQTAVHERCAERDEAREALAEAQFTAAWSKSFGEAHDAMQDALKAIAYHADNQDIGHVDFRMHAKRQAEFTLEQCAGDAGALDGPPLPAPEWSDMASLKKALAASEARRGELEAENAALRIACMPFMRAWALGRRSFMANGLHYETASRSGLGLSDDGSLQVGDFERLAKALAFPALNPHQEGSRDHG